MKKIILTTLQAGPDGRKVRLAILDADMNPDGPGLTLTAYEAWKLRSALKAIHEIDLDIEATLDVDVDKDDFGLETK